MDNGRTLIYTCCDKAYSHFIPLFCASLLYSNDNVDIEIGVNFDKLDDNEETILNILREKYPSSKILVKYNFFTVDKSKSNISEACYGGKRCMINTVRFLSEPQIKDEYTYISDIDVISLDRNFTDVHIQHMHQIGTNYSNRVREKDNRMTGLHFCITNKHYPINLDGIDTERNDEQVLHDIVAKKEKIDYKTAFRPVHGIHMSPNRKEIGGTDTIPGWDADDFKDRWYVFSTTDVYKQIYNLLDNNIKELIVKLEKYYGTTKVK